MNFSAGDFLKKIKIGIIGVGNCASNLIQGLFYYKNVKSNDNIPGLMHSVLGEYKISVSCAKLSKNPAPRVETFS